ncbi:MAG: hypothetical protein JWN46_2910 [Acidimicrobiales bacterium]|nr:hypothetical protein [Acidimicrobiales bacterium]
MHVEVGPLPSSSVLAWVGYAEAVLGAESAEDRPVLVVPDDVPAAAADVPYDAISSFAQYLIEWRAIATAGPVFTWSSDIPGELAEYLVLAFYRVVRRLNKAAEARGEVLAPPEGEAFYNSLVDRLLRALAAEGPGSAEFADHLRSFWPGMQQP